LNRSNRERIKSIKQTTGIKGSTPLTNLRGINLPGSFPVDTFHFVENIMKVLWRLWSGQEDGETIPAPAYVLPAAVIKEIDADMVHLGMSYVGV